MSFIFEGAKILFEIAKEFPDLMALSDEESQALADQVAKNIAEEIVLLSRVVLSCANTGFMHSTVHKDNPTKNKALFITSPYLFLMYGYYHMLKIILQLHS